MLVFYPMPCVFYAFTFVFRLISCTNILTRCPRPVVVFLFSEILLRKYSRNGLKIHGDQFLPGMKTDTEGDPEGGRDLPKGTRRGPTLGRAWAHLGALATAFRHLFAYKLPLTLKILGTELFSTKHTERRCHHESPI